MPSAWLLTLNLPLSHLFFAAARMDHPPSRRINAVLQHLGVSGGLMPSGGATNEKPSSFPPFRAFATGSALVLAHVWPNGCGELVLNRPKVLVARAGGRAGRGSRIFLVVLQVLLKLMW